MSVGLAWRWETQAKHWEKQTTDPETAANQKRKFGDLSRAAMIVGIVCAVGVTVVYGFDIYPSIPKALGGGQSQRALMLFTKTGATEVSDLGIHVRSESQISVPVKVLLDQESFYAVRTATGSVVQIAKSSVDGLIEDSTLPHAVDVQTRKLESGLPGYPDKGDQLILKYSEVMDTEKLIPGWTGKLSTANLEVKRQGTHDQLRLTEPVGKTNLGTIVMSSGGYTREFGGDPRAVRVRQRGRKIIITLGSSGPHVDLIGSNTMTWTPSSEAADLLGNPCKAAIADERIHGRSRPNDPDF